MPKPRLTDEEFIATWAACGRSPRAMSATTGYSERWIHSKRAALEANGFVLHAYKPSNTHPWAYRNRCNLKFSDGVVIIYSDPHFQPGLGDSTAFKALIALCKKLKPYAIIANGDLIDGAKISRFPRPGWAKMPSVTEEIGELQLRQAEIRKAAPKAKLYRTIGNHDLRFDRHLASQADQYEGLHGFRLSDHLPDWEECYTVVVNDLIVKHRNKGGIHAKYNNVLHSGTSICTAHLHTIGYVPIRGYRDAPIYGIETGTLSGSIPADISDEGEGPFEYVEDGPTNWVEGFAVLTFENYHLLPPEHCIVQRGHAYFRGQKVT